MIVVQEEKMLTIYYVEEGFRKNNTRFERRQISLNTLLNLEARTVIEGLTREAVLEFIYSAKIHL